MLKTERLINIVMMLLAQDVIAASTFAELFHVTKRTIMRDMDALSAAHIPVAAKAGVNGGFYMLDSYKFDKRLLANADLENILTAVSGLDALMVAPDVTATLSKLSGMLATPESALSLDFSRSHLQATVALLRQGIVDHRLAAFDYFDRQGLASSRLVEPYHLLWRNGSWYLVGYAIERQAFRTFRVSRMLHLTLGDGFNPRKNVPAGWQGGPHFAPVTVTLGGSQACRSFIVEHFGAQVITESRPDGFQARVDIGQNSDTFRFLAQCGTALKVVAPSTFQRAYRDYLQAMVDAQR